MAIDFDPAKDSVSRKKHGVPLDLEKDFDWSTAVEWVDDRMAYGEERRRALGYIHHRLFHLVFVVRAKSRRVISLRKANKREQRLYEKATKNG